MLTYMLATVLCAPFLLPAQEKTPEKVLTLAAEPSPMSSDHVPSVSYSPDGKLLACDCKEGLALWEMPEGKPRGILPMPVDGAGVAFSADGKLVAIGKNSAHGDLQVWDAEGCKLIRSAPIHFNSGGERFLAFNGDASRIAALTLDGVSVFATTNLQRLDNFQFVPKALFAHPDGKTLILASADKAGERVLYVDFKTGKPRRSPVHGEGGVEDLSISQDGSVLATTLYLGDTSRPAGWPRYALKLWDSKKQTELWSESDDQVKHIPRSFRSLQVSPDGRIVGCFCQEPGELGTGYLHLWSVKDHTPLWPKLIKELNANAFTFSPVGKSMAVVHNDSVSIWKLP